MLSNSRVLAVDVFRGLTLALMILVNTPGSWSHIYWPFAHADWHGLTPTDFVFPFFLFIVGSSMAIVMGAKQNSKDFNLWTKALKRGSTIFVVGLLLHAFPFNEPIEELRIMGVLQRIGLSYVVASTIVLYLPANWRIALIPGLLLIYWALPWLLIGNFDYSLEGNLGRQLDMWLIGESHMWQGKGIAFDPESLLGTLTSVVTVLIGFESTKMLLNPSLQLASISPHKRVELYGVALIVVGLIWSILDPINKSLWTGSFVMVTSAVAMLLLSLTLRIESSLKRPMAKPWIALGANPLFLYVLSWLWVECLYLVKLDDDSGALSLYQTLFESLSSIMPLKMASLCFALLHVMLFTLVALWMHKRKIFIRL